MLLSSCSMLSAADARRRRCRSSMPAGRLGTRVSTTLLTPPAVDEIVAVMRHARHARYGNRLNGLMVVLWRAGLRVNERERPRRAGARRVDGAQVDSAAGRGSGAPAHARGDSEGPAGKAVSSAGGADRFDCGRGRHSLSDRFGAGRRRDQSAGPGGSQAGGQDRRQAHRGQGSFACGGPPAAGDHPHDAPPLRAGQGGGPQADRPASCWPSQSRRRVDWPPRPGAGRGDAARKPSSERRASSRSSPTAASASWSRSTNGSRASRSPTG